MSTHCSSSSPRPADRQSTSVVKVLASASTESAESPCSSDTRFAFEDFDVSCEASFSWTSLNVNPEQEYQDLSNVTVA